MLDFISYLAVKSMHIKNKMITSDFSIHLMQRTSKVQMPITFLLVNKNIKCG